MQCFHSTEQCWEESVGDADQCVICSNTKPSESDCHALQRQIGPSGVSKQIDGDDNTCTKVKNRDGDEVSYDWAVFCEGVFGNANSGLLKDNYFCGVDPLDGGNDGHLAGQLDEWNVLYQGPGAPGSPRSWEEYLMQSCHIELPNFKYAGEDVQKFHPLIKETWDKYKCEKWENRQILSKPKKFITDKNDFIKNHVFHTGDKWYKIVCKGHDKITANKMIDDAKKLSKDYKKVGDVCDKEEDPICNGKSGRKSQCTCEEQKSDNANVFKCESNLYVEGTFCELPLEYARDESFKKPIKLQDLLGIKDQDVPIKVGKPCGKNFECGPKEILYPKEKWEAGFKISKIAPVVSVDDKIDLKKDGKEIPHTKYEAGSWETYGKNICECKIEKDTENTECITRYDKKTNEDCYTPIDIYRKRGKFHRGKDQSAVAENQEQLKEMERERKEVNAAALKKIQDRRKSSSNLAVSGYNNVYDDYDYDEKIINGYKYQYGNDYFWMNMIEVVLVLLMGFGVCVICCIVLGCMVAAGYVYFTKNKRESVSNYDVVAVSEI